MDFCVVDGTDRQHRDTPTHIADRGMARIRHPAGYPTLGMAEDQAFDPPGAILVWLRSGIRPKFWGVWYGGDQASLPIAGGPDRMPLEAERARSFQNERSETL